MVNEVEGYVEEFYSKIMENIRIANLDMSQSKVAVVHLEYPTSDIYVINNTNKELIRVLDNLGYDAYINYSETIEDTNIYRATVKWVGRLEDY